MIDFRTTLAAGAVVVCALLSGCGQYGVKGDKGLAPAPDDLVTPNVNLVPRKDAGRPLKTANEQGQMKSGLVARTPRAARSPRPFDAKDALRQQQEQVERAAKEP